MIFVLAKTEPGDPEAWDDYTENNKDMFDANQNKLMIQIQDMNLNKKVKKQN